MEIETLVGDRWIQRRPTASAALLVALGYERGVQPEVLLHGTGLDVVAIHDQNGEITAGQELRIVSNLLAAVDEPGLGFTAGRRYHFGLHGPWTYAVLSSPTLGSALELATRYVELTYTFFVPHFRIHGNELRVYLDSSDVPEHLHRFLIERDLAMTEAVGRSALNLESLNLEHLPVMSAHLTLPRPTDPRHVDRYVELLGVEPEWEAEANWVSLPGVLMDLPLSLHSEQTARAAEEACAQLLSRRRSRVGFAGEVRQVLAKGGVTTSQTEVAARLNVGLRTLRRRLADEGTSFRALSQETWGLLAEELLATGLTVEQVADRLGYASASSFSRAFKTWTGQRPGVHARTLRG